MREGLVPLQRTSKWISLSLPLSLSLSPSLSLFCYMAQCAHMNCVHRFAKNNVHVVAHRELPDKEVITPPHGHLTMPSSPPSHHHNHRFCSAASNSRAKTSCSKCRWVRSAACASDQTPRSLRSQRRASICLSPTGERPHVRAAVTSLVAGFVFSSLPLALQLVLTIPGVPQATSQRNFIGLVYAAS